MTLLDHYGYANSSGRRFLSVEIFNCYIHRAKNGRLEDGRAKEDRTL